MSKSFSPILDVHRDVSYCVGGFGEGLDHPECVAWGCDGYAYAGGEAGQIYRIDIENGVFEQFFKNDPPARSAVEVKGLPMGVRIEMEAIALKK